MKSINGVNYIKIGEVASRVNRSTQTVKIWYEYAQDNNITLPEYRTDLDGKGTRYWLESDVPKLIEFRDGLTKGMMVGTTQKKWGKKRVEELNKKGVRYGVNKYLNNN